MGKGSAKSRLRRLKRLGDGDYPALTIRYGRRFLLDYPDVGIAWLYVGISLCSLARYEEAEQAYSKALEHCPADKRHIPLGQMGHLFRQAGDYDQAADWYRRAIEVLSDDATYWIFLGCMLAKQGRLHDAEETHRSATRCIEGCIDEAYLNLGLILRARERFGEAAECFREAIRLDPDYRAAYRALRDVERCIEYEEKSL